MTRQGAGDGTARRPALSGAAAKEGLPGGSSCAAHFWHAFCRLGASSPSTMLRMVRLPRSCTAREDFVRRQPLHDRLRLRKATGAVFAAGHLAFGWLDDLDAVGEQLLHIPLCRRVLPHADV